MATHQQITFDFLDAPADAAAIGPKATISPKTTGPNVMETRAREAGKMEDWRVGEDEATRIAAEDTAVGKNLVDTVRPPQEVVLRKLRAAVGCIQTAAGGQEETEPVLSTGSEAIDRLLPRGGLRLDAITEWVAEEEGCGAETLAMIAAATHLNSPRHDDDSVAGRNSLTRGSLTRGSARRGPLVIVSGEGFYPPAAIALGISAEQIIWVRPRCHADLVWSIDQALRCESVAAVWAGVGANLDDRDARRFQLAAEVGRTPGLLIRPAATRGCPTFADVRLHVANQPHNPLGHHDSFSATKGRIMKITLDRCRGGSIGHSVWVRIDDQARLVALTPPSTIGISENDSAAVRLASELAHPKTSASSTKRRRA